MARRGKQVRFSRVGGILIMSKEKQYKYTIFWSEEDEEWVATVFDAKRPERWEYFSCLNKDPCLALYDLIGLIDLIEDIEDE